MIISGFFGNKQGKLLIKEAARTLDKADGLKEQDKKSIAKFLIKKMIKSMKEIEGQPVPSSKLDEILKKQVNIKTKLEMLDKYIRLILNKFDPGDEIEVHFQEFEGKQIVNVKILDRVFH